LKRESVEKKANQATTYSPIQARSMKGPVDKSEAKGYKKEYGSGIEKKKKKKRSDGHDGMGLKEG
jgi:hypothetical protein